MYESGPAKDGPVAAGKDMHVSINNRASQEGGVLMHRVGSLSKINKSPSKSLNVVRVRHPDGIVTFRDRRHPLQQYEANLIIKNHIQRMDKIASSGSQLSQRYKRKGEAPDLN